MLWRLKTSEGVINLSGSQVVAELTRAIVKANKKDLRTVVEISLRDLEKNALLKDMRLVDMFYFAALVGYFYRIFMTQNEVQLEEQDESSNPENAS